MEREYLHEWSVQIAGNGYVESRHHFFDANGWDYQPNGSGTVERSQFLDLGSRAGTSVTRWSVDADGSVVGDVWDVLDLTDSQTGEQTKGGGPAGGGWHGDHEAADLGGERGAAPRRHHGRPSSLPSRTETTDESDADAARAVRW
jgi:hypothetical protein